MNAPFLPGSGFRDAVFGPQAVFRAVLDAMSRPGRIVAVPEVGVRGPDVVPREVLSILLALCDQDTPIWLDPELRAPVLGRWLAFHANAPVISEPANASFAVLRACSEAPRIEQFQAGDARYPDRSATLIVLCDAFTGGAELRLEGPGIEASARLAPRGLPNSFIDQVCENHALYPRGVDFLLIAEHAVCGLPRSTRIVREAR